MLNGEGTPAVRADIGFRRTHRSDRRSPAATAARGIDASGLIVAPGFIDMDNHSDYTVLVSPIRKHDPPGSDDDGAGRVAIRWPDRGGAERRVRVRTV